MNEKETNRYRITPMMRLNYFLHSDQTIKELDIPTEYKYVLHFLTKRGFFRILYDERKRYKKYFGLDFYDFQFETMFLKHITDAIEPCDLQLARGFSSSKNIAISKGIGESLERIPFLYYKFNTLKIASESELRNKKINFLGAMENCAFTEKQMKYWYGDSYMLNKTTKFYWIKARELIIKNNKITEKNILVPAQLILWTFNFSKSLSEEPNIYPLSTHGGAGHFTKWEAILIAIYEWIARDGFFVKWLKADPPILIDVKSLEDTHLKKKIDTIEKSGWSVFLFLYKSEIVDIPNIFCVIKNIKNKDTSWKYTFGSGCDMSLDSAIESSLDEAMSMLQIRPCGVELSKLKTENWGDMERLTFTETKDGEVGLAHIFKGETVEYKFLEETYQKKYKNVYSYTPLNKVKFLLSEIKNSKRKGIRFVYFMSKNKHLKKIRYCSIKSFMSNVVPMFHTVGSLPEKLLKNAGTKLTNKNLHIHPFP